MNIVGSEIWGRRNRQKDELDLVYEEYSNDGWDGFDAIPISSKIVEKAKQFLDALPLSIPAPEIIPEPDGTIGFEWCAGPRHVFSVSIEADNTIVYAGLFGQSRKAHGVEIFDDSIPSVITEYIKRV